MVLFNAGNSKAARIAMIAMTTSNSTSVNATDDFRRTNSEWPNQTTVTDS